MRCEQLVLSLDHILAIGVDQGEEGREVDEFLLQELEAPKVFSVQE